MSASGTPALSLDASSAGLVAVIVFGAFFVRGISGFGSATIAIPLMAHIVPLRIAVPLLLVLDFVSTLATLRIDRALIDRSEIAWLIPSAFAGVILGATLLIELPAPIVLTALGGLVVAFGLRTLLRPVGERSISRMWALPAGFTGGFFGGMFGSGAATPYMIYLTHRLRDKRKVRATFTGFAFFDYGFRLITFALTGLLLDLSLAWLLAVGIPAMAIGQLFGNRLHHRISNDQALQVIGVLLIASGVSLVAKVWL